MTNIPIQNIIITDTTSYSAKYASAIEAALQKTGYCVSHNLSAQESDTLYAELIITQDNLTLKMPGQEFQAISIDFCNPSFLYRIAKGGGRKQALAKAIGLKPNHSPHVFDATAGLGRDGFILASLGCRVTMCEQSAIIHALLADGLQRAATNNQLAETTKRIKLYQGDSCAILAEMSPNNQPEVVYLDPMFPSRRKSSLVKKEMQALHLLLGNKQDNQNLLGCALKHSKSRVVCKRPKQADPLPGPAPNHAINTKKHRFDVYLL